MLFCLFVGVLSEHWQSTLFQISSFSFLILVADVLETPTKQLSLFTEWMHCVYRQGWGLEKLDVV